MLMPSIFRENLLDDFFDYPFSSFRRESADLMRTDIQDTPQGYEITINLPGIQKEDVRAELHDGYLTIQASSHTSKDEKDDNGTYIRRERYSGSCSRSFYVGEDVTEADVKARFENGTLKLLIPKKEEKQAVEEKKYIPIEG